MIKYQVDINQQPMANQQSVNQKTTTCSTNILQKSTTLPPWPRDGSKSRGSRKSAVTLAFLHSSIWEPNPSKLLSRAIRYVTSGFDPREY